jgi:membrane-anchored protein YejM (alkaline phosphatase superfamily)
LRTETAGQDPCQADAHTGNTSVNIVSSGMDFIRSAHRDGVPFYVNIWLHVSHNRLDPTAAQKAAAGPVCKQAELATNQTECAERVFIAAQQDADAQIGRLDAMLGELDLHESTLILFSTDNGPEEQQVYSNAQGTPGPFRGRCVRTYTCSDHRMATLIGPSPDSFPDHVYYD